MTAPPGQKEPPQLWEENGGGIEKAEFVGQPFFAIDTEASREFVNFPVTRGSDRSHVTVSPRWSKLGGGVGAGGLPKAAGSPPPPMARSSLGIDGIRAAVFGKLLKIRDRRAGFFDLEIFPSGIQFRGKLDPLRDAPDVPVRGDIVGFSNEAAARLKRAFMELHVPGSALVAFTLTTHRILSPEEWRAARKRFRIAVKKRGWAGIWRVELQRRKTPHEHVAMWLPPASPYCNAI